jgi:branched-chain amino acid transport system permease protein
MSTRVPNFALGTIMITGAYASYTCKEIADLPVYIGFPVSFIAGALLMLTIGVLVLEPLLEKGRSLVEITLATIGLMILLEGLIQVYHGYLRVPHSNIMLKTYDFHIGEVNGVFPVSTVCAVSSFMLLRQLLGHTRLGCSIRAVWSSIDLAQLQGIDPRRVRLFIWVISGGFAGLAGAVMTMWFHLTPVSGSWVLMSVFAAASLGGFDSIGGAFIGGLLLGLGEILLVTWGQSFIGVWVGEYRLLVSLLTIVLVFWFFPNGLFGQDIQEEYWKRFHIWGRVNRRRLLGGIIFFICFFGLVFNTCRVNRKRARQELFSEFAGYDLEVRERERGVTRFQLGNLTVFKSTLSLYNVSKVYVEPYGSEEVFS